MMTLEQLLAAQSAAGQRYASAVTEMHAALIDLAAIDEALAAGAGGYDRGPNIRTFFNLPQNLGTLSHPVFAPANVSVDWRDEIKAQRDVYIASFSP